MFLKIRLNRLEKKMGIRKTGLVMSIVKMKRVVSAYRLDPSGTKQDLNYLEGLSLEELHESLEKFEKQGDNTHIVETAISGFYFGTKKKSPADSHAFDFNEGESDPAKRTRLPKIRKEKKVEPENQKSPIEVEAPIIKEKLVPLTEKEVDRIWSTKDPRSGVTRISPKPVYISREIDDSESF